MQQITTTLRQNKKDIPKNIFFLALVFWITTSFLFQKNHSNTISYNQMIIPLCMLYNIFNEFHPVCCLALFQWKFILVQIFKSQTTLNGMTLKIHLKVATPHFLVLFCSPVDVGCNFIRQANSSSISNVNIAYINVIWDTNSLETRGALQRIYPAVRAHVSDT